MGSVTDRSPFRSGLRPSTVLDGTSGLASSAGAGRRVEKHLPNCGKAFAEALLRDVRFLSAIGLHTQGMTLAQSEKMFRESAFADAGNARQQAARGTYDPAYLNYTLGKLMIRKLRSDWVAKQAGAASAAPADQMKYWQAFHDKFLSYGGPPIPLVRKYMLGEGGSLF